MGWGVGCVWFGGRCSQLGIFVQLGLLSISGALPALPALLLSFLDFLDSLCIFYIGVLNACFFSWVGLGCRLCMVRWQMLSAGYSCLSGCFKCIWCLLSYFCSSLIFSYFSVFSMFSFLYLLYRCIKCVLFSLNWVGLYWVGDCVWLGGRCSHQAIFAQMVLLGVPTAFIPDSALFGLLGWVGWQLILAGYLCSTWVVEYIWCSIWSFRSSCSSLNFLGFSLYFPYRCT